MRAVYLDEEGLRFRQNYPRPQLAAGEATLRLRLAGICSTDLELIKGYAGFQGVLGHEFVATVEEVEAEEDAAWVGKRVVGTINLGCWHCSECAAFGPEHCPTRTVLGIIRRDGAFADFLTLPTANLLEVPESLADEEAVFTEPLAAALRIRQQITVSPSDRVAVVGPGRLGLLIGQVLALAGGEPTLFGRRKESLELPEKLGLDTGLIGEAASDAFDLVVEATGNEGGLAESLRLVRPKGTLVLKSTFQGRATVDLTKLVVGEVRVTGSRCGPFAPALRLLEQGAIQVKPLIEAEYSLREAIEAFEHAARPGVRKILLRA
ncbi:MAG: alcohol dehydrogenase catalytic domain-containing protein [Deltaproteobacteria bacterium]|nr:alcohol dehydrogenase catalytic domain-containing protein [Deltaproteobacteria bacterium]